MKQRSVDSTTPTIFNFQFLAWFCVVVYILVHQGMRHWWLWQRELLKMFKKLEFFVNSIDIIFSNEYESHSQQNVRTDKKIWKFTWNQWHKQISCDPLISRNICERNKKRLCGFFSFLELLRQKLDRTKSIKMLSLSSKFLALLFHHQPRYFICKNCRHFGIHLPTQNVDCNTKISPFFVGKEW